MPVTTDETQESQEVQEDRCDICHRSTERYGYGYCECHECSACGHRLTFGSQDWCSSCDRCHSCCECYICGWRYCQARIDSEDYCFECERCWSCCCCCDEDEPSSEFIHDYSYRPDEVTWIRTDPTGKRIIRDYTGGSTPDAATYLGLEIETEAYQCNADDIAEIWTMSPFGYAKHDGSLSDGAECVTWPITYQALKALCLETTLGQMAKMGARAWGTGTCGLHIHVSRRAFEHRSHLWRFCRALDSLQGELIRLAGRHSQEWASWVTDDPDKPYCSRPPATKVVAGKAYNGTRYRAINLENRHTVELRFWRGTLNPVGVLGAAAIVDGLVEWTRPMPFRAIRQGLSWSQFVIWARANLPTDQWTDIAALAAKRLGETETETGDDLECAS